MFRIPAARSTSTLNEDEFWLGFDRSGVERGFDVILASIVGVDVRISKGLRKEIIAEVLNEEGRADAE